MIGNKILELRKFKNWSQEQLAEKMDVTRQTISKWELGETAPDLEQSKKLSKIFEISLDDLTNNEIKNIIMKKVDTTNKIVRTILNVLKIVCLLVITIIIVLVGQLYFKEYFTARPVSQGVGIICKRNGIEYKYETTSKGETPNIIENFYTNDKEVEQALNIDVSKYNDMNVLIEDVRNYVESIGGNCDLNESSE